MKKLTKILLLVLVMSMFLSLVACGAKAPAAEAPEAAEDAKKVAVVFTSSGLGDHNINDLVYSGLKKAEEENGLVWDYAEPSDSAEYEGLLSGFADTEEYSVIICLGGSQSASLENVAPNYPEQNFCILDAYVPGDNIRCYSWRDEELGFVTGVIGAAMSETGKLGFIGAMDIELCNLGAAGLTAGARYVNPDAEVFVDYANAWEAVDLCYEMSTAMSQKGATLVYHTAGSGGLGILNAGKDNGFNTVFFAGTMNTFAPDTNVACTMRNEDACAVEVAMDALSGNFTADSIELGYSDGAFSLYTEGSNFEIPEDVMALYDEVVEAIVAGDIVVPKTIDEALTFTKP